MWFTWFPHFREDDVVQEHIGSKGSIQPKKGFMNTNLSDVFCGQSTNPCEKTYRR